MDPQLHDGLLLVLHGLDASRSCRAREKDARSESIGGLRADVARTRKIVFLFSAYNVSSSVLVFQRPRSDENNELIFCHPHSKSEFFTKEIYHEGLAGAFSLLSSAGKQTCCTVGSKKWLTSTLFSLGEANYDLF